MMDNCKIVTDLLPSYCDGLTSLETTQMIEAHIADCSDCAGTLMAMKNRKNDQELENNREEFRRALRFYEFHHKLKALWIVLVCAIAVIVFFVLQAFSMEMALTSRGISLKQAELVSASVPYRLKNEDQTRYGHLIWSRNRDDKAVLAHLRKNFLGFWYVDSVVTADSTDGNNPDCFLWTDVEWNTYGTDFESFAVAHVVFVGDNAMKRIDFPQEALPEGTQAWVRQKQNHYMIYVTGIMESGTTYVWNVRDILEENGFIPFTREEEYAALLILHPVHKGRRISKAALLAQRGLGRLSKYAKFP